MKFNNFITFYAFLTMTMSLSLRAALVEQVVTREEATYIKSKNKAMERAELVVKKIDSSIPIPLDVTRTIVVPYLASHFIKTTEFDLSDTEIQKILTINLRSLGPNPIFYHITLDRPWLLNNSYSIPLYPTNPYVAGPGALERTSISQQKRYKTIRNTLMPFSITFANQTHNLIKDFSSKDIADAFFSNDENESYCCCIDFNGRATILSQIEPDIIFSANTSEQDNEQT